MVKVRMNTADVAAEVKCLRRLIGMRCSNVYDLNPKTYVFKLISSSGVNESGESEKVLLLMESGIRLHTTVFLRDKSNTPLGFTMKLRKHIRTRRLEDVRQLGYDRIILFQFGLGANAHYIILELYAQGNILLTDADFTVLTLLRSHRDDNKGIAIMSRHRYPVEQSRVFERTTTEKMYKGIESFIEGQKDECVEPEGDTLDEVKAKYETQGMLHHQLKKIINPRAKQATLKVVLGEVLGYGPALSEHMILDAGLIPSTQVDKNFKLDSKSTEMLVGAVVRFEDWLANVISGEKIPKGYILMKQKIFGKRSDTVYDATMSEKMYDEFCPLLLNQFKSRDHIELDTFDAALDEFYSKIESQRSEQQQKAKESSAMHKLEKIKLDQENRVHALEKEVEQSVKMAALIQYNLEDVDSAIMAVRVALANGMSWLDLAHMVKEEKKAGNPVAGLIDKLHLERNCITLLLSNNLDEMDDDEKTQPVSKVEVDLALSAHANARHYYGMKKKQESKQEKTITSHEKAFKAAERKTRQQLSQEKTVAMVAHMRKVHWFEKFNWFISSENYLVISGRDAQQNEMIVKRYMSKGDLYVHADLHGASSTVIKNHKPDLPVPPLTLNQAGCFTVCHSQAWDSKIVTSAWWVYTHQVSKTAPTGEYLTVGSFMVRGKKNFLPPHPLVMGFGILFRMDESSLGFHLNERRVRGEDEGFNGIDESKTLEEISESGSDSNKETSFEVKDLDSSSFDFPVVATSNDFISSSATIAHKSFDENDGALKYISDGSDSIKVSSTPTHLEDLIDGALRLGSATTSVKDYDLEIKKPVQRDKSCISKADRRKLKKGTKNGESGVSTEHEKSTEGNYHTEIFPENSAKFSLPCGGKITRGQKGKLKKIKEKYADQDDEERSIRMAQIAAAGTSKKDIGKDENAKASEQKEAIVPRVPEDATKVCYKCKKAGHMSKDCPEKTSQVLQIKPDGTIESSVSDEVDKVAMDEDDILEIGVEEKEKVNEVDYLTGNPLLNDALLYAIPVCGPYNALQSYKYRVKIIPGSLKKGKAAKTAMNLFTRMPEATAREKELMKACTDPEIVAAILGNVKISAPGLTQLKQKQKKTKKAKSILE